MHLIDLLPQGKKRCSPLHNVCRLNGVLQRCIKGDGVDHGRDEGWAMGEVGCVYLKKKLCLRAEGKERTGKRDIKSKRWKSKQIPCITTSDIYEQISLIIFHRILKTFYKIFKDFTAIYFCLKQFICAILSFSRLRTDQNLTIKCFEKNIWSILSL